VGSSQQQQPCIKSVKVKPLASILDQRFSYYHQSTIVFSSHISGRGGYHCLTVEKSWVRMLVQAQKYVRCQWSSNLKLPFCWLIILTVDRKMQSIT